MIGYQCQQHKQKDEKGIDVSSPQGSTNARVRKTCWCVEDLSAPGLIYLSRKSLEAGTRGTPASQFSKRSVMILTAVSERNRDNK